MGNWARPSLRTAGYGYCQRSDSVWRLWLYSTAGRGGIVLVSVTLVWLLLTTLDWNNAFRGNRYGGCEADPHFSGYANPPIVFSPLDILIVLLTLKMPPNGRISPQGDWFALHTPCPEFSAHGEGWVPVELYRSREWATHISTDSTCRATMVSPLD